MEEEESLPRGATRRVPPGVISFRLACLLDEVPHRIQCGHRPPHDDYHSNGWKVDSSSHHWEEMDALGLPVRPRAQPMGHRLLPRHIRPWMLPQPLPQTHTTTSFDVSASIVLIPIHHNTDMPPFLIDEGRQPRVLKWTRLVIEIVVVVE